MLVVVLSQLAPHTRSQDRAVSSCPSTTEGLSLGNGEWQTHSKLCCSWVSRNLKPSSVLMDVHSLPSFPHQVFPFFPLQRFCLRRRRSRLQSRTTGLCPSHHSIAHRKLLSRSTQENARSSYFPKSRGQVTAPCTAQRTSPPSTSLRAPLPWCFAESN